MKFGAEQRLFARVTAGLFTLLLLTFGLFFLRLGALNLPLALLIAMAKAALVVYFFMDLRLRSRTVRLIAAAGLVWFVLLLGGVFADVATRLRIPF